MKNADRKEWIPFGEEWDKEMMKWTKPMLIDFLKKNLIEKEQLEQRLSQLTEQK